MHSAIFPAHDLWLTESHINDLPCADDELGKRYAAGPSSTDQSLLLVYMRNTYGFSTLLMILSSYTDIQQM